MSATMEPTTEAAEIIDNLREADHLADRFSRWLLSTRSGRVHVYLEVDGSVRGSSIAPDRTRHAIAALVKAGAAHWRPSDRFEGVATLTLGPSPPGSRPH